MNKRLSVFCISVFLSMVSMASFADVDCTDPGSDCQQISGTIVQVALDNGAVLNAYNPALPFADKTNSYMLVKINGGTNSAASFTNCSIGYDEAIGILKLDTAARERIYESAISGKNASATDAAMVVDDANGCEIASFGFYP